jgi:hypothetical protein
MNWLAGFDSRDRFEEEHFVPELTQTQPRLQASQQFSSLRSGFDWSNSLAMGEFPG